MSFLVSASLAFFSRARTAIRAGGDGVVRWVRLGNLVNLVALVCVVTGYSTTSFTNARGEVLDRVSLPVQTKIGAVLYVVLSVAIFSATVLFLRAGGEGDRCTRIIKGALVVATPLMLFRSSWSVYTVEEGSLLHPKNIWVKLVLQYVAEFAALVVLTAVGFGVGNVREEGWDVEDGDGYGQKPLVQQTYGYQQQQQTVPMTYPPPPPPQQ
ncbi:hypothetical protein [Sporisorium scitamineum]|nr:hypothetical protein [Sporisorium scitamineum]